MLTPQLVQPEPTTAEGLWVAIPARSRRQAMDWSLVLVSQGIETVIEHRSDGLGWALLVNPEQQAAATAAIRQYRLENRHWGWQRRIRDLGFTFHWGVLAWCWALILWHWFGEATGGRLEVAGAMNHLVPRTGEWWRLLTATMLHADVGHLAANVSTGILLLGLAMGRYGAGWALLASLLAGAGGNAASLLFHTGPYRGLGASGVVMGALGLLAVQSLALWRNPRAARRSLMASFLGGVLLFVLFGLSPRSDVVAHTGGFLAGVGLGCALNLLPERFGAKTMADRIAGAVAVLTMLGAWMLALGR